MAKLKEPLNPIVIKRGVGIGTGNAESDDEFLFDCFVDYPPVEPCLRTASPAMIISGRTGAGKTAILRHIESVAEYHVTVDPYQMAMGYVANSDSLRFLRAIGADLDLFFQVLWKHVLCIEFIRLRWQIENTQKSQSIFQRLADRFNRDERKSKALAYLQEWQGKFWITMDQNIKEVTETIEKKLHAEIGAEIEKFKAGGQYDKRISNERKSEIVARTRKIISSDQLSELHGVIEMLSVAENGDQMKAFYILIDQLDERWVDDSVRFRMIKGLMESLKSFRKIQNLKILVALRTDVLERVVQETSDISFQREKFEDNTVKLFWMAKELKTLVEKRITSLFKRQYTDKSVVYSDVFPDKVGAKDSFDWILERTLLRPRDVIAFVNECFEVASGNSTVSVTNMRKAEGEYSRKRKDALLQEWLSSFPTLSELMDFVSSARKPGFSLSDHGIDEAIDDMALNIAGKDKIFYDPMHEICSSYMNGGKKSRGDVMQEAVSILYRVGVIGVKISDKDHFVYSHSDQPIISASVVTKACKVKVHPMLQAAFHLHDSNQ